MGTISFTQINDGENMDASDVNNPLNTIYGEFNGNIDNNNVKASANIDPSKIAGLGADAFSAYQSWSPTWTNLTVGNGTLTAKYVKIGKNTKGYLILKFGSTTSISGIVYFTLPVACSSSQLLTESSAYVQIGVTRAYDNGTAAYSGPLLMGNNETTKALPTMYNASATYVPDGAITSTAPFTWATNDQLTCTFDYEAA